MVKGGVKLLTHLTKSLFKADATHFYSVRQLKILQANSMNFSVYLVFRPKIISPVPTRWYRIYTEQKLLIVVIIIISKSATKNRQNPGFIALHRKTCKFQEFYIISSQFNLKL